MLQSYLAFMLYFYTDIVGLTAFAALVILSINKILDLISDLIVGYVSGKHIRGIAKNKRVLALSAPVLSISLVFCFQKVGFAESQQAVWSLLTLSLMLMAYSVYNINYCALINLLTEDGPERERLISTRFIFAILACLAVHTFTIPIAKMMGDGDVERGFTQTIIFWAMCSLVLLLLPAQTRYENATANTDDADNKRTNGLITGLLKIYSYKKIYTLIILLVTSAHTVRTASAIYYVENVLGNIDYIAFFNACGIFGTLLGVYAHSAFSRKRNTDSLLPIYLCIYACCLIVLGLVSELSVYAVFAMQFAASFFSGATVPAIWSKVYMLAEDIGALFCFATIPLVLSAFLICFKTGSSFGAILPALFLDISGYSNSDVTTNFQRLTINNTQCFIPAVFALISFVLLTITPSAHSND